MIFNCGWCKREIDYMWLTNGLCPECAEKSREQDRKLLASNPKLAARLGYRR